MPNDNPYLVYLQPGYDKYLGAIWSDGVKVIKSTGTTDNARAKVIAKAWAEGKLPFGYYPKNDALDPLSPEAAPPATFGVKRPVGRPPKAKVAPVPPIDYTAAPTPEGVTPTPAAGDAPNAPSVPPVDGKPGTPPVTPTRDANATRANVAAALGVKPVAPVPTALDAAKKNETLCMMLGAMFASVYVAILKWSYRIAGREAAMPDEKKIGEFGDAVTAQLRIWFVDIGLKPWHTIALVGLSMAVGMWLQGKPIPKPIEPTPVVAKAVQLTSVAPDRQG